MAVEGGGDEGGGGGGGGLGGGGGGGGGGWFKGEFENGLVDGGSGGDCVGDTLEKGGVATARLEAAARGRGARDGILETGLPTVPAAPDGSPRPRAAVS